MTMTVERKRKRKRKELSLLKRVLQAWVVHGGGDSML
jgi:hypothetical protein